ncbi:cyclin-dependent kinase [Ranunculus cassubicifolius]
MAAGRNGDYSDSEELRDRESDIGLGRNKDFYYQIRGSNVDYDRDGDNELDKDGDGRERFRLRQKDIKEREVSSNGGSNSSSGTSGSDRRGAIAVGTAEREPGELSSGSGSDGEGDVGSGLKVVNDIEVNKMENGVRSPPAKKRKFSPIVWDRDETDSSNSSKMKAIPTQSPLSHPPLVPKVFRQSPSTKEVLLQGSPAKSKQQDSSLISPGKLLVAPGPVQSSVADSPERLSSMSPLEHPWNNNREPGQIEEEVPARNISASRWADVSHSPRGEGEISDDEDLRRRKKMPGSDSLDGKKNSKALSPEVREIGREGSEGNLLRSSESCGRRSYGSTSEGDYPDNEFAENDYMDTDDEANVNNPDHDQSDIGSEPEEDIRRTPEPVIPPQRSIDMLQGCRSVDEYERLNKIDEGTYGVVYRAKDKKTGEIVALKKVKMEKEREGFPLTSLREINILLSFHHPSIVDVKEVVVGSNLDSIFMVMEYMEHDLKGLMESMKQPFSQSEVKCLMLQLLEGVKYLHDNWVLHRDLKTSNLLLNNRGELKICDFGLSRQYGSPLKPYTHLVVTLWYRAPELLLGGKLYSTAIDMWSLGCIMAEFLAKQPLFNGKTEVDQLDKIFRTIGTPNETIWPGFSKLPGVKVNFVKQPYNLLRKKFPATSFTGSPILSEAGFDLLNKLLTYDPQKRISADEALNHEWFREVPLPKSKDFMPTFPAQHAQDRRLRRIMKSPDPLEEQRRKELQQKELGSRGLFG